MKQFAIVYLDRQGILLYHPQLTSMLSFSFPAGTVRDLDLINKDELEKGIVAFLNTNKVPPTNFYLIFSEAICFEKDVPLDHSDEIAAIEGQFLDGVPFEKSASRRLLLGKVIRIEAVNAELYGALQEIFQKVKFTLVAAISASILRQFGVDPTGGLTSQVIQTVLKNSEGLKAYHMTAYTPVEQNDQEGLIIGATPKQLTRRTAGLAAIFGSLMIILFIMVISRVTTKPAPITNLYTNASARRLSISTPSSPSATLVPLTGSPTAMLDERSTVTVLINNPSSLSGVETLLTGQLQKIGLKNILVNTLPVPIPVKAVVAFSPTISSSLRADVGDMVKKIFGDFIQQDSKESKPTISILTIKPL